MKISLLFYTLLLSTSINTIFINYSHYSHYRMTSSIQISKATKELIGSFGRKEDTYENIIKVMYKLAVKEQLRSLLMSSEDTLSVKEAREFINQNGES